MIRVVVAEDHTLIRESVIRLLSAEPDVEVVADAQDGGSALEVVEQHRPLIAVLDISMPVADGLTVAMELHRRRVPVSVVFMTMYGDEPTFRSALQAGARGYILKSDSADELLNAIRAVAGGGRYFSTSVRPYLRTDPQRERSSGSNSGLRGSTLLNLIAATCDADIVAGLEAAPQHELGLSPVERAAALIELRRRREEAECRLAPFEQLTGREQEVLAYLIEGVPADAIAQECVVSVATVRTQIRSVLQKLDVNSQLAAVAMARRAGWSRQMVSAR